MSIPIREGISDRPRKLPWGAHLGTIGGTCGASIGFCVACWVAGVAAELWPLMLGSLVVSFALGVATCVPAEILYHLPHGEAWVRRYVGAAIPLLIGTLLILANGSVVPAIEQSEPLKRVMTWGGGTYLVPNFMAVLSVLFGAIAMSLLFLKLRREFYGPGALTGS